MNTQTKQQPVHKIRFGNVKVAIWENTSRLGRTFYSFDLERSYLDQNENWHNQNISLGANEIPKVIAALTKAYEDYYTLPQLKRDNEPSQEQSGDMEYAA